MEGLLKWLVTLTTQRDFYFLNKIMLYDQISSNKRRTVVLILVFFLILSAIGAAVAIFG